MKHSLSPAQKEKDKAENKKRARGSSLSYFSRLPRGGEGRMCCYKQVSFLLFFKKKSEEEKASYIFPFLSLEWFLIPSQLSISLDIVTRNLPSSFSIKILPFSPFLPSSECDSLPCSSFLKRRSFPSLPTEKRRRRRRRRRIERPFSRQQPAAAAAAAAAASGAVTALPTAW